MTSRITISQIDSTKPSIEWKHLLADRGRRRHMSYTMDFDTRARLFEEPGEAWDELPRRLHLENRDRARAGLAQEFGEIGLDAKIENFVALGFKPFSIVSYHNAFFDQARQAFVIGAYYPALLAACALGERILNHLILDLREFYRHTPEYRKVGRKRSFSDWSAAIDILTTWDVLLPRAAEQLRALMPIRHRSVHFNTATYINLREDSLAALICVREIVDQQFTAFGARPWFIEGTKGFIFIKREWETNPFVQTFYLPTCPFLGPYSAVSFRHGLRFYDHDDYD